MKNTCGSDALHEAGLEVTFGQLSGLDKVRFAVAQETLECDFPS